jgi:hypothetical protein
VAHSLGWEGGRVEHTGMLTRDHQEGVFLWFAARRASVTFGLGGMVGDRRRCVRFEVGCTRAALQAGVFVAQMLVLGTERQQFGMHRLNRIE